MKILLTTSTLLVIAWISHLVIWRIRLPRHQTRTLLLTFATVFAFWLITLASYPTPLIDALQISLLYISVSFCYVITYSAVEGDSPTLSLVNLLAEKKDEGLPIDEIDEFVLQRPFVKARLAALIHSGLIRKENDLYIISGRPSLAFRIILGFRKLYGPITKGG
jgi:hypothetical protein